MRNILAAPQRGVMAPFAWSETLLAFDFDGTLAPIVADPDKAAMRSRTRTLLRQVAELYPCIVISGRPRADVANRVKGLGLRTVVGSHGLEFWKASTNTHPLVRQWIPWFEQALQAEAGVTIEDKQHCLVVHFRRSRAKKRVRAAVAEIATRLEGARLVIGVEAVTVIPRDAQHKGMALERERARLRCDTAIYVGDDDGDEDVFALDQPGRLLSVRVGRKPRSKAHFYINSQVEIDALLEAMIGLRQAPTASASAKERRKR